MLLQGETMGEIMGLLLRQLGKAGGKIIISCYFGTEAHVLLEKWELLPALCTLNK